MSEDMHQTLREKAKSLVAEQRLSSGRSTDALEQTAPMVFGRGAILENTVLHVAADIIIQDGAKVSGHIRTTGSITVVNSEFDGFMECEDMVAKGNSTVTGVFSATRILARDEASIAMKGFVSLSANRKESGRLLVSLVESEAVYDMGQSYLLERQNKEPVSKQHIRVVG